MIANLDFVCPSPRGTPTPSPEVEQVRLSQTGAGAPAVRVCKACGVEKPISSFRRCARGPFGVDRLCKACRSVLENSPGKVSARRKYYEENKETLREKSRQYQAALPEGVRAERLRRYKDANKEIVREYNREYRKRPEQKEYCRRYQAEHRDLYRCRNRKWKREHPELVRGHVFSRRARLKGSAGYDYTTPEHVAARWAMWGDKCWMCGAPATCTDHVIPLSRGGASWPANLRPACRLCNSVKQAKPLSKILPELAKKETPNV